MNQYDILYEPVWHFIWTSMTFHMNQYDLGATLGMAASTRPERWARARTRAQPASLSRRPASHSARPASLGWKNVWKNTLFVWGPGDPLKSSAPKFPTKWRAVQPPISHGDPFRDQKSFLYFMCFWDKWGRTDDEHPKWARPPNQIHAPGKNKCVSIPSLQMNRPP